MQRRPADRRLRRFVSQLWATRAISRHPPGVRFERVLPTGAAHLVIRLGGEALRLEKAGVEERLRGSVVGGIHATAYAKDVSRPVASVGAMLEPGALPALFGVPADAFADRHVQLADLIGAEEERLVETLLGPADLVARLGCFERWLGARIEGAQAPSAGLLHAIRAADRDGLTVAEMAHQAGLSARRFSSRFRAEVGVPPKRWLRLRRFQRVVDQAGNPDRAWSEMALALGFSDQAHLAREFRAISELTPTAYRRLSPEAKNHVPLAVRSEPRPISSRRAEPFLAD